MSQLLPHRRRRPRACARRKRGGQRSGYESTRGGERVGEKKYVLIIFHKIIDYEHHNIILVRGYEQTTTCIIQTDTVETL